MHHIGRYYTYESLYTLVLTYIPTNVPIRFLRVYLHATIPTIDISQLLDDTQHALNVCVSS